MNELPEIEIVYEALKALYHNPDHSSKERASQWLGDLQKSVGNFQITVSPKLSFSFSPDIRLENSRPTAACQKRHGILLFWCPDATYQDSVCIP